MLTTGRKTTTQVPCDERADELGRVGRATKANTERTSPFREATAPVDLRGPRQRPHADTLALSLFSSDPGQMSQMSHSRTDPSRVPITGQLYWLATRRGRWESYA